MWYLGVPAIALFSLQAFTVHSRVRHDLGAKNVEVAEIDKTAEIDEKRQEIIFIEPKSDFEDVFRCSSRGTNLLGSTSTAFDCCKSDTVIVGCSSTGYACCPEGNTFNGKACQEPKEPEPEPGTPPPAQPGPNKKPVIPSRCNSDVHEGLCYTMSTGGDKYVGYDTRGWYSVGANGPSHQFGKFKFCKTAACNGGGAINPSDSLGLFDVHGQGADGSKFNQWVEAQKNHITLGKVNDWAKSGAFTLSKWTEGKYCLGGHQDGINAFGATTAADAYAFHFVDDLQACIPVELTEVPCDVHNNDNNCIWSDGSGACPAGLAFDGSRCAVPAETHPVTCPVGYYWKDGRCHAKDEPPAAPGRVNCPTGSLWDGVQCLGSIQCPEGSSWDGHFCAGKLDGNKDPPKRKPDSPIKLARPDLGDTSFSRDKFPCTSADAEKPCRGTMVQNWKAAHMYWNWQFRQPGAPQPAKITTDYNFPVMMSIVDVEAQSEHFLLHIDGKFLGETNGEVGYKNVYVGDCYNPEWCLTNGYTRGYFIIPAGHHEITVEWPQGTGKYLTEYGGKWNYGVAKYRFDHLCDAATCA